MTSPHTNNVSKSGSAAPFGQTASSPFVSPRPVLEPVMRPSMEAAASRKNALLFDFELEATRGIMDWGRGI
jgi:hypothetical protein